MERVNLILLSQKLLSWGWLFGVWSFGWHILSILASLNDVLVFASVNYFNIFACVQLIHNNLSRMGRSINLSEPPLLKIRQLLLLHDNLILIANNLVIVVQTLLGTCVDVPHVEALLVHEVLLGKTVLGYFSLNLIKNRRRSYGRLHILNLLISIRKITRWL